MEVKNAIIRTENLTKRYEAFTAVNRLNLNIHEGEIFGLLGPNGAGKTTTILMLMGLTEPSEGVALVGGYNATRDPIQVKRIVGYLPDNVGFYEEMTGKENLFYTAALNGLSRRTAGERIAYLLKRVGLENAAEKPVGTYSRGMMQRLGIADVLVKDPRVVILDEPTNGIDPEGITEMLDLIVSMSRNDGRTVLVSSHMLHQVQQICDQVSIFCDGKMIASGPIKTLGQQLMAGQPKIIEVKATPDTTGLVSCIRLTEGVTEVERHGELLWVYSEEDIRQPLLKQILGSGFELSHFRLHGYGLEDIYHTYFTRGGM